MMNLYKYYKGRLDEHHDVYRPLLTHLLSGWFLEQVDWTPILHIIKNDPYYAYKYARDVIKGGWSEAEQYIMKDPFAAYCYARDIIKGRWKEAEPYIMTDSLWWHAYRTEISI